MKIYKITFTLNGNGAMLSITQSAKDSTTAKREARSFLESIHGKKIKNMKANAIVFGADGKGKSLNKLKKK